MKKLLSVAFVLLATSLYAQTIENIHTVYGVAPITLNDVVDSYSTQLTKVDITANNNNLIYTVPLKVSTAKSYKPYNHLLDLGYHASFNYRDTYYYGGSATFTFISNDTGYKYQTTLGLGQYNEKGYILPTIMSNLGSREPAYGKDSRVIYIEAVNLDTNQQSVFKVTEGSDSSHLKFTFLFNKNPNEEMLNMYLPWAFNGLALSTKLDLFDNRTAMGGREASTFYINTIDLMKLTPAYSEESLVSSTAVTSDSVDKWVFVGDNTFKNETPYKAEYQTSEFNRSMTSTLTVTNTNATGGSRTSTYKITLPTKADVTTAQTLNYTYTHAVADAEAVTSNYVAKSQKVSVDAGCEGYAKVYMGFGKATSVYKVTAVFDPNTRVFTNATKLSKDHIDTNYYGSFNLYDVLSKVSWVPAGISLKSDKSVVFTGETTVTSNNSVILKVETTQKCPTKPDTVTTDIVK